MGSKIKLVVALLMGLFAAMIVVIYLQTKEAEYLGKGQLEPRIVAKQNIPQWTEIDDRMIGISRVPAGFKQPGSFLEQDKGKVVGQIAIAPILKDEQITATKLAENKEQSLATILAASGGKRTVTIGISGEAGVASMLKPADYVDIIGMFTYNIGGRRVEEARYFKQNVLILALDTQTGYITKPRTDPKTGKPIETYQYGSATLAVSAEDALRILLANKLGKLYFTLRPAGDDHREEVITPIQAKDILGNDFPIWREADERASFLPPDVLKTMANLPK
ncbi:MAG: Flp pilus assembly protein CpaB [Acidobacteriota bacterium]